MDQFEILKWAAGANIFLPEQPHLLEDLGISEVSMGELIWEHRLSSRFIHRYKKEHCNWCNRTFLFRILNQVIKARQQTNQQIALIREISSMLAFRSNPIIPIKGVSVFALLGETQQIRWSGDIDLFYDDLQLLQQTLLQIGYAGEDISQGHEYSKMSRGFNQIEVHRYCPIFSYSPEISAQI